MEQLFSSKYAVSKGSRNLPGVSVPAVDTLLKAISAAKSRPQLVAAMRALDRVVRSHHYWIPNWYSANHRVAYWDMFGFKEPKPDYEFPVEQIWWIDQAKAKTIGKA
jgi:microcin C transport system substrate-binding protein